MKIEVSVGLVGRIEKIVERLNAKLTQYGLATLLFTYRVFNKIPERLGHRRLRRRLGLRPEQPAARRGHARAVAHPRGAAAHREGRRGPARAAGRGHPLRLRLPATRSALLRLAAVSFSVQPYQSLAPYFAREVYHGGSEVLGYLIGAGGLGALSGIVSLAVRPSVRGLLSQIPFSGGGAGLALIVFSYSGSLWLGLPMIYFVGMGAMVTAASTNTILQTIVEDRMRARVVSLYMMSFLGVLPIGAHSDSMVSTH